jgi:hypothetical protein
MRLSFDSTGIHGVRGGRGHGTFCTLVVGGYQAACVKTHSYIPKGWILPCITSNLNSKKVKKLRNSFS